MCIVQIYGFVTNIVSRILLDFCATVCKTVRPMLSDRCLSCPVCDVGVLWPSSWTDQDETWRASRPRPLPHCVRWGPSFPHPKKGAEPQFSAHVYCAKTAGWIKMSPGTEVGLVPGDVLDGDHWPAPPRMGAQAAQQPLLFGPLCYGTVAHLSNCWALCLSLYPAASLLPCTHESTIQSNVFRRAQVVVFARILRNRGPTIAYKLVYFRYKLSRH